MQNYKERKLITVYQDLGLRERLSTKKHQRMFWDDGKILYLDCGVFIQCTCLSKLTEMYTKKGEFY